MYVFSPHKFIMYVCVNLMNLSPVFTLLSALVWSPVRKISGSLAAKCVTIFTSQFPTCSQGQHELYCEVCIRNTRNVTLVSGGAQCTYTHRHTVHLNKAKHR